MTELNPQEYYHGWNLIRSEPVIFNSMIRNYGVNGVIAEDVFTLDDLPNLSKVDTYGILLAYRYAEDPLPVNATTEDPEAENIIFTPQLITNSCATVGLFNVLCNAPIDKGDIINQFIDFTDGFDNINRGLALGNDPVYRNIHNSYNVDQSDGGSVDDDEEEEGQQSHGAGVKSGADTSDVAMEQIPAEPDSSDTDSVASGLGNSYHFVAYIFHNHCIWELDGLKPHPIRLQRVNSRANWLNVLKPILANKIQASALTANIISIAKDPVLLKEEEVGMLLDQSAKLAQDIGKQECKGVPFSATKSRKLKEKMAKLDSKLALLRSEIKSDKADADERLNVLHRDLVEYFPFIEAAAKMAMETGMDLEAFRRPPNPLREGADQRTPSEGFNRAWFTAPLAPRSSEYKRGKDRLVLSDLKLPAVPLALGSFKDYKGKGRSLFSSLKLPTSPLALYPPKNGEGAGRYVLFDPKIHTKPLFKRSPKDEKGRAVESVSKPPTTSSISIASEVFEDKRQETGTSATEQVQESTGKSEVTMSDIIQGNVEDRASTPSTTAKEARPTIEEPRQEEHLGKRKFDDVSGSDEEPESPPAKKK